MDNKPNTHKSMFQNYPEIVDVGNLSVMLGISKKTAYRLIADGSIASVKIGRSYKIPKQFVVQYLVGINHAGN